MELWFGIQEVSEELIREVDFEFVEDRLANVGKRRAKGSGGGPDGVKDGTREEGTWGGKSPGGWPAGSIESN